MRFGPLLFVSLFIFGCFAAIPEHKITSLPGLVGTLGTQYSGYINNVGNGTDYFYWFVQSEGPSLNLVLWLNGGPGCSSLDGLLYENGPFKWSKTSTGEPTLVDNPFSWHLKANMLYLESPGGVGFSTNPTPTNDTQTAEYSYSFLTKWFESYPEYKSHKFYIAGESYAGKYVPMLANRVLKSGTNINLVGILVGNGLTDAVADGVVNSLIPFAYGHGLISTSFKRKFESACNVSTQEFVCEELMQELYNMFTRINTYNIYKDCYHQRPSALSGMPSKKGLNSSISMMAVPCINSNNAEVWLNNPAVKRAIHAQEGIEWSICNSYINENYYRNIPSMIPTYKELLNKIRVLIYSGNVDASVPYTGTEYWTRELGGTPRFPWRPWYVKSQVGGFVTVYPQFTFTTIHGAGHMVPQYKPMQAFYMFSNWLENRAF